MAIHDPLAPSRRELLASALAGPAALTLSGAAAAQPVSPPRAAPRRGQSPLVGIQIGAVSFVDEGVDRCLEALVSTGGVNTLMAAVFTYGTGLAGRQSHGQPLPDHGVQKYDSIHGGSYTAVHPEFYANSVVKDVRAPDLGTFDILKDVVPRARVHGMRTYALFEENYNPSLIPNFAQVADVELHGRTGGSTCFNNPHARAFLTSMVSDWVTSNPDLDGLMWESERQGPLNSLMGAHFNDMAAKRQRISCFCDYCKRKAEAQGIDAERAHEGFRRIDGWLTRTLAGPRQADGAFVSLWRLLTDYPEVIAWERFWVASQEEVYGLIYGTAKTINPTLQVGWHIMQLVTMSPFYSADTSYARLADKADFLKPSTYNNCAGPPLPIYVRNLQSTMFRDLSPDQVLQMTYGFMGLTGQPSLADSPKAGSPPLRWVSRPARPSPASADTFRSTRASTSKSRRHSMPSGPGPKTCATPRQRRLTRAHPASCCPENMPR